MAGDWQRLAREGVAALVVAFVLLAHPAIVQPAAAHDGGVVLVEQIVRDPHFEAGFHLLHPREGQAIVIDRLDLGNAAAMPVWRLAQWSSNYSLAGASPQILPEGGVMYANEAKRVIVGTPGSPLADLTLEVNAHVEYPDRVRQDGEPWAHLLVEQEFATMPKLSELEALRFSVSARLLQSDLRLMPGYTPSLHAAQFLIYFTVQNRNPRSPGFGDFYWFGVPIYDDRYAVIPRYQSPDFNTSGKYIFTPGSKEYTDGDIRSGQWLTIEKDLLPLMLEGLEDARAKGFLPDSGDPEDYVVSGMNMGWEVPGPFHVAMQVRDLKVTPVWKR